MKKILFYSGHQEDIGHTIRLLNIIKAIRHYYKGQSEIFIFQAGKRQKFINFPEGIKAFDLPYPFYSRLNLKMPVIFHKRQIESRTDFMLSNIKTIRPDIFITEFFPFGRLECKYELLPILRWLMYKRTKIYSCLPIPYFVHSEERVKELLSFCNFYDKILIHTPPDLDIKYISNNIYREKRISKANFLNIFKYLNYKIYFTGYIIPLHNRCDNRNIVNNKLILVHRGGGTTSPNIITHSILASRLLDSKYKFLVVAGAVTTQSEIGIFKKLIEKIKAKNVLLKRYLPGFFSYLENCKVCIGTAGGTTYELLYLRKNAILIPFMGYPNKERTDQLARAQMLKDYTGASILDYNYLTPKTLAQEIIRKISSSEPFKNRNINANWFDGAKITADIIMSSS